MSFMDQIRETDRKSEEFRAVSQAHAELYHLLFPVGQVESIARRLRSPMRDIKAVPPSLRLEMIASVEKLEEACKDMRGLLEPVERPRPVLVREAAE